MNCNKKSWLKVSFGMFAAAGLAGTVCAGVLETVDFSTYADTVLTRHSDWAASGTPASRLEWKTKGGRAYTAVSDYAKVFYATQMPPSCETYSAELTCRMEIPSDLSTGYADVLYVGLSNAENKHGDALYLTIRRDVGSQWRLIYSVVQSGLPAVSGSFGRFYLKNLDSDGDGTSDDLALKVTLIRGETEKDWKLAGLIQNTVTGRILEENSVDFISNKAFFSGNLVAFMGGNCSDEAGGVKSRSVSKFQINTTP
jgi:hypothetical protein